MFCRKCGNKLEDEWVRCPFCGESTVKVNSSEHEEIKENEQLHITQIKDEIKPKKKNSIIKKLLIGMLVLSVFLIILVILGSDEEEPTSNIETNIVKTMEEVGGYEQWVADEYPGKVRTDIVVDLPIAERDSNDYCVHILTSLGDPIYIMQEDEANVFEWEWLQNAVADMEEGNTAAFQATLTLCGYVAMDSGQVIPKFIAEDIEPYTVRTIEVVNEPEDNSAEFIFPTSDRAYLAEEEIRSKTTNEMFIGRNEIFARHGYIFESDVLKAHFGNTSWYEGTILGSNFNADEVFNEFEQYNVALIKQIEDEVNGVNNTDEFIGLEGAYQCGSSPESGVISVLMVNEGIVYMQIGTNELPDMLRKIEATIIDDRTAVWQGVTFEWTDVATIRVSNLYEDLRRILSEEATYLIASYYHVS